MAIAPRKGTDSDAAHDTSDEVSASIALRMAPSCGLVFAVGYSFQPQSSQKSTRKRLASMVTFKLPHVGQIGPPGRPPPATRHVGKVGWTSTRPASSMLTTQYERGHPGALPQEELYCYNGVVSGADTEPWAPIKAKPLLPLGIVAYKHRTNDVFPARAVGHVEGDPSMGHCVF